MKAYKFDFLFYIFEKLFIILYKTLFFLENIKKNFHKKGKKSVFFQKEGEG